MGFDNLIERERSVDHGLETPLGQPFIDELLGLFPPDRIGRGFPYLIAADRQIL